MICLWINAFACNHVWRELRYTEYSPAILHRQQKREAASAKYMIDDMLLSMIVIFLIVGIYALIAVRFFGITPQWDVKKTDQAPADVVEEVRPLDSV